MPDEQYVLDTPLPDYLNYERLVEIGLAYIQTMGSNNWSHLNKSDPGVTILNQLCYALTELGYCIDFPIEDILTGEKGSIEYTNQFFLPEEILTCSPVTWVDYVKLILDRFPQVKNVQMIPISPENSPITGIFQVDLFVDLSLSNSTKEKKELIEAVHYFLLRNRNLGEFFLKPKTLKPVEFSLSGTIYLENDADVQVVREQIQLQINNYLWPKVSRYGYQDLEEKGETTNDIFNGPRLENGWIQTKEIEPETIPSGNEELQPTEKYSRKIKTIRLTDIFRILLDIYGVKYLRKLNLCREPAGTLVTEIPLKIDEVAYFILPQDSQYSGSSGGELHFYKNSVKINPQTVQKQPKIQGEHQFVLEETESIRASLDLSPPRPEGKFRAIEDYYSIQNTFPETYALGMNKPDLRATEFRKAQSKQLKGYLMVFDQLLANQFSQLAQVPHFFSFSQAETSGFPENWQDKNKPYPLPYQKFSPTYFFQTLYNIPNIRPVLAGNEIFRHSFRPEMSLAEQKEESWKEYQKDPYNQYRYGLAHCMESDEEAEDRRSRMLDHLLARHGESGAFCDEGVMIPRWAGSFVKTQIMTKGIFLQNYRLLSYKRQKAYDFLSADPIKTYEPLAPTQLKKDLIPKIKNNLYVDFQLNVEELEKLQALDEQDFVNFSTFELKLNLFLGLRQHYYLLISVLEVLNDDPNKEWEGGVMNEKYFVRNTDIYVEPKENCYLIFMGETELLKIDATKTDGIPGGTTIYQAYAKQLLWLADERKGFILLETILLLQSAGLKLCDESTPDPTVEIEEKVFNLDDPSFYLNVLLIFPCYVSLVQSGPFQEYLQKMLERNWPANVVCDIRCSSFDSLQEIIPNFTEWHNNLRFQLSSEPQKYPSLPFAEKLVQALIPKDLIVAGGEDD